jgi:hypothetical protein
MTQKPWGETSGPTVLTINRDGEIAEFNQQDIDILSAPDAFALYGTAFYLPERKVVSHHQIIGELNIRPGGITYISGSEETKRIGETLGKFWRQTLFAHGVEPKPADPIHNAIRKTRDNG